MEDLFDELQLIKQAFVRIKEEKKVQVEQREEIDAAKEAERVRIDLENRARRLINARMAKLRIERKQREELEVIAELDAKMAAAREENAKIRAQSTQTYDARIAEVHKQQEELKLAMLKRSDSLKRYEQRAREHQLEQEKLHAQLAENAKAVTASEEEYKKLTAAGLTSHVVLAQVKVAQAKKKLAETEELLAKKAAEKAEEVKAAKQRRLEADKVRTMIFAFGVDTLLNK